MTKKSPSQSYLRELNALKKQGKEWGLSDDEVDFAFQESLLYVREKYPFLYSRSTEERNVRSSRRGFPKKLGIVAVLVIAIGCGLNYHKPTRNFVERNIQEAIYPFMKFYRRVTLPLINWFPSLTELYDESCLVENPYFQVSDMDCWPCENVRFVLNLTDSNLNYHVGLPFIMKLGDPVVTLTDIEQHYQSNREMFSKNADKIKSNYKWNSMSDFFSQDIDLQTEHQDLHVAWRINRMEPGRALRTLLKPPLQVPKYATAIGIERYILLDGPKSPAYNLPTTEGANVFIKQLSGRRLIVLEPTTECQHACHRLPVLLLEQHILWYNWWYWRPRSLPVANSTDESLALLGSTV